VLAVLSISVSSRSPCSLSPSLTIYHVHGNPIHIQGPTNSTEPSAEFGPSSSCLQIPVVYWTFSARGAYSMRHSDSSTAINRSSSSARSCNDGRRSPRSFRNWIYPGESTRTTSKAAHSNVSATLFFQSRFTLLNLHMRDTFTLLCRSGHIFVITNSSLRGGNNVAPTADSHGEITPP
jgi:hypothetical protein